MNRNKLIIKNILLKDLNLEETLVLIKISFETFIDKGIVPTALNLTTEQLVEKKEYQTFSAFYENKLIGILIYKINNNVCYIDKICIHPQYQSLGIGKILISELFVECKMLKIKKIWLYTFDYNRSIKFYESLKFYKYSFKHNSDNYFSVVFCKYFNENKIRNHIFCLKYCIEKFLYKKVFFYNPSKMTAIGFLIKKIKNYVFKK